MESLKQAIYFTRIKIVAWVFLKVKSPLVIVVLDSSGCPVPASLGLVQMGNQVIFKSMVIEDQKEKRQDDRKGFLQASNISQPVKHIVSLPVHTL